MLHLDTRASILSRIPDSLLGPCANTPESTSLVNISLLFHLFVAQRDVAQQREVGDVRNLKESVPLESVFFELIAQLADFIEHPPDENPHVAALGRCLVRVDEEFNDLKSEQALNVRAVLLQIDGYVDRYAHYSSGGEGSVSAYKCIRQ